MTITRLRIEARPLDARPWVRALGVALLVAAGPLPASARATRVIELFTSQGCPKCPPADRLIAEFAKAPDTIALSFAVNYWDYTGWKDTLASPIFTRRQHAYADARGDRRIFTPQAIVDGIGVEPGSDESAIVRDADALAGRDGAMSVPISVASADGRIHVDVGAAAAGTRTPGAGIYLLRVARSKTVQIGRGENSGRSVTYKNAVRAMTRVGDWTGAPVRLDMVDLKGDDEGYVVLLQSGAPDKPGMILAAAKTADL